MNGPEFFQTLMGRRYYEHTLPELVRQITRIADGLERLVERLPAPTATAPHSSPVAHSAEEAPR